MKPMLATATANSRAFELDGLRGLAALSVFFSHVAGLAPAFQESWISHSILRMFWDGPSAVTLFFVLSGYVLSLPFTGEAPKRMDLRGFILRRVTRLYPAYWCALIVALGLRYLVLRHNDLAMLSIWAGSLWAVPITFGTLVSHFFMITPRMDTTAIDPVIWSLVVEMKFSLVFPLLLFIVRRTSRPRYALMILTGFELVGVCFGVLGNTTLFVSGMYLAKYRTQIIDWASRLSAHAGFVLLTIAILLYENASIAGEWGRGSGFTTGIGALLLVLLALTFKPLSRLTTIYPSRFLGDVSYSFYLLHLPILLAVSSVLWPMVQSRTLCATVALLMSLGASKLLFNYLECPMQGLGRRLAKGLSRDDTKSRILVLQG